MNARLADFFERAHDTFNGTAFTANDFALGGGRVRFQLAGAAMTRQLRAFAHLHSSHEHDVDLTVCAWDDVAAKTKMLPRPWSADDFGRRGEISGFNSERFRTAFDLGTNALSMIDLERRLALFWTPNAENLPAYECAAPFRSILHWWAERRGSILIHGAAVANRNGAVLLAGPGGSGKSTTAFLCLKHGWQYLADDYCLLQPAARIFSLYNSLKLSQNSGLNLLPSDWPDNAETDGVKRIFFLHENQPERIDQSGLCRALILPRLTKRIETSFESASPAEGLRALAPSSLFQLAGAGAPAFEGLSQFVRSIPAYRLNLGRDYAAIPGRLEECLNAALE